MTSNPRILLAILAALVLGASSAPAQVVFDAAGVLEQYCAETDDARHPRKLVMRQLVTTDRLATFGGTVFAGVYQADRPPVTTGTMSARLRIEREDGSREKLDRIVARQLENGMAEVLGNFPVAVRKGDTVVWKIRFNGFDDLATGECFLVIGATMKPWFCPRASITRVVCS